MTGRDRFLLFFPPVCFCLLVSLRLWIISPFQVISRFLPHDDLYYVELARAMLRGEWLGLYNNVTLTKAPGYPLWLAFQRWLELPPLIPEQFLYILVAGLLYRGLVKAGVSPIVSVCALAVLLFAPEVFSLEQKRFSRLALYDVLTMLLVILCMISLRLRSWRMLIAITLLHGAVLGFYALIREESMWVAPIYGVFAVAFFLFQRHMNMPRLFARTALVVLVPWVMAGAVDLVIRQMNQHYYGVSIVFDQRDGNFPRAMGAIARIKVEKQRQYVPLPREARYAAYKVSPTFAKLKPVLERGIVKEKALLEGCLAVDVCTDLTTGWVFWAVRNAADKLGHYRSAEKSELFFQRIAEEVNGACDRGEIDCGPPHNSLLPIFRADMIRPFFSSAISGFQRLLDPDFLTGEALVKKNWWLSKDGRRGIASFVDLFPYATIYQNTQASDADKERLNYIFPLRLIWPWIVLFSVLGALWYGFTCLPAFTRRRKLETRQLFLLCLMALFAAGAIARVLVLALVDATSFPGFGHYMLPAYGQLAGFCTVALAALFDSGLPARIWRQVHPRLRG